MTGMRAIGVIPARLGSTRLKEKVLRPLCGRPMIYHVWKRVSQARKLSEVMVACDDPRVAACVEAFGGKAVMTRPDHPNGSSRIAEAAEKIKADILINIQGDEPLIHPEDIDSLVEAMESEPSLPVATLAVCKCDPEEFDNPGVVKVVCSRTGDALYFSRSPIPHYREGKGKDFFYWKHLGIYGYRKEFLLDFVSWNSGMLENTEKLEQLRILEQGVRIRVVETPHDSFSVDTEEDVALVESKLKNQAEAREPLTGPLPPTKGIKGHA